MRKIKVGDTVRYKPWGNSALKEAKVDSIEICRTGTKYGKIVDQCDLDKHSEVVFELDNGHWCYKNQVTDIINND